MPSNKATPEEFWAKVRKTETCWIWTGAKKKGYGFLRRLGLQQMRAHRYAWYLTYGELPSLYVLHECDNPSCVNPAHLFLGTAQDNSDDMMQKGRHKCNPKRGEDHGIAKLTKSDVLKIRRLIVETTLSQETISTLFMVHPSTIGSIANRKTWAHV